MRKCLLFFLLLVLSSCSDGWKKDAFESETESVKNAVPFAERKRKIPPPDRDVIFMDFESVYKVVEGETQDIAVKYTIGHDEVKFQKIVVRTSNEFPGLNFDEQNEIISITPPEEFVDASSKYKLQVVEVSLFAEYKGVVLESISKINVMVLPRLENRGVTPEVLEVVGLPDKILFDGEKKIEQEFKVYVFGSTEQPPSLQAYSGDGIGQYITIEPLPTNGYKDDELLKNCDCQQKIDETKEEGRDIWEFKIKLSLPEKMRLFTRSDKYELNFVAYSFYGVPSTSNSKSFTIFLNKAQEPKFIGEPVVKFFQGSLNSHTFLVVDNSGLSRVSASCKTPVGSTCRCQEIDFHSSSCTLEWKPESIGEFEVEVSKIGQIFDDDDLVDTKTIKEKFRVHVVESKNETGKRMKVRPSGGEKPGTETSPPPSPSSEGGTGPNPPPEGPGTETSPPPSPSSEGGTGPNPPPEGPGTETSPPPSPSSEGGTGPNPLPEGPGTEVSPPPPSEGGTTGAEDSPPEGTGTGTSPTNPGNGPQQGSQGGAQGQPKQGGSQVQEPITH